MLAGVGAQSGSSGRSSPSLKASSFLPGWCSSVRRPHVLDGSSAPLGVLESSGNCLGFRVGCEVGFGS